MVCIACARPAHGLCRACETTLERPAHRSIAGVLAVAAFEHRGAARRLVAHLKYRRSSAAARFLAAALAEVIPPGADVIVPVPRALVRRIEYGIDPAAALARALSRETGLPVVPALSAPVWWRSHAGRSRAGRTAVAFRPTCDPGGSVVLVDDVLTTGRTVTGAILALGSDEICVATATSAGRMGTGANSVPVLGGAVARKRKSIPQRFTAAYPTTAPTSRPDGGLLPPGGLDHPREEHG